MISLVVGERATAVNIKDRTTRHAVQDSLSAVEGALRRTKALPANGLAIFSGGGELTLIEPPAPLRKAVYLCGSSFATDELLAMCSVGTPVGVVVIDGSGCFIGVADGVRRTVVRRFAVDLPHKHSRGGQSAARFGRLADEARSAYVTRAVEALCAAFPVAARCGAGPGSELTSLVVVGAAETKSRFVAALPPRLRTLVSVVEDVAYGGAAGFAAGCALAEASIACSALVGQRVAVAGLEEEIGMDRGRYVLGEAAVLAALAAGAAVHVLVAEAPPIASEGRNLSAAELSALATASGAESVMCVADSTPEGARFCRGLTGVAALLRWAWRPPVEDEGVQVDGGLGARFAADVAIAGDDAADFM